MRVRRNQWSRGTGKPPDFIIAGVQKGGTTSLYHYLSHHPQVVASLKKEVNFFDQYYGRGLGWYLGNFPTVQELEAAAPGTVTGEASPNYLVNPHVAGRIAADLPEATKIIVLLRDPVRRTYSQYQHMVRLGLETLSFQEALDAEEERIGPHWRAMQDDPGHESDTYRRHSYRLRSDYARQLSWWFEALPRDRFLILQSETFFRDTQRVLHDVQDFLGIERWDHPDLKPYNQHGYPGIDEGIRDALIEHFRPRNEELFGLLGTRYDDWLVP